MPHSKLPRLKHLPKTKPKHAPAKAKTPERVYETLRHKGRSTILPDFPNLNPSQRRFIAAYSRCGNITEAAELARLTRQSHYAWLWENVNNYAEAFKAAQETAVERLEAEARRRAMASSDTLLIFLLKGYRPDRYRDNYRVEMNGPTAVEGKVGHFKAEMTDDEFAERMRSLARRVQQRRDDAGGSGAISAIAGPIAGQADSTASPGGDAAFGRQEDTGRDGRESGANGQAGAHLLGG
jgi:hypothetical protein